MLMVQTILTSGSRTLTTWLPKDSRVKPGKRISLEEDDTRWDVVTQFDAVDSSHIQHGWNVGGIKTVYA
jgi:hypothetical protein